MALSKGLTPPRERCRHEARRQLGARVARSFCQRHRRALQDRDSTTDTNLDCNSAKGAALGTLRGEEATYAIEGCDQPRPRKEHEAHDIPAFIIIRWGRASTVIQGLNSRHFTNPNSSRPAEQHGVPLRRLQEGERRPWAPSSLSFRPEPPQLAAGVSL